MGLTIYTKHGCPYCAAAMRHYRSEGVDFEERNVQDDPAAMQEFKGLSPGRVVPVMVEDGSVTIGWGGEG